jgi:hypothetical protein
MVCGVFLFVTVHTRAALPSLMESSDRKLAFVIITESIVEDG